MIEEDLKKEIEKWLKRIKNRRKNIKLLDETRKDLLKNIDAYISDSRHFLRKNDLIKSFEAVIWSWTWISVLEELDIIRIENHQNGVIVFKK